MTRLARLLPFAVGCALVVVAGVAWAQVEPGAVSGVTAGDVGLVAVAGASLGLANKLGGIVQTLIVDRVGRRDGGGGPAPEAVRDGLGALATTLVSDREHLLTAAKQVQDIHAVIAARDGTDQGLTRLRHEEHVRASLASLASSVQAMTASVDRLITRLDRQHAEPRAETGP